ncbi:unnamed protein product [Rotaria sp. Silwood1]|nr:unnamed protein product [Rotaria sp. Silwood1]
MCIGSTGRCWPDLLRELSKVQIADGLHERCFFCFDVNGDTDITQLTLVAEKQFYENLCDDLLSSTSINNLFGTALERHKAFPQNGVPIQPLEVGIQAATSAVALVFSFLLPQAVLLFNYESFSENKLTEEAAIDDRNLKMTKQEMTVLRIEKLIMKLKCNFFFKSCITDRHFRDKRVLVGIVLNDFVERHLLHEGHDDAVFFDTGCASSIQTYLKYIPSANDEQRFRENLMLARSGNNDSQNTQSTYDFKDINQRLSMIPVDNSIHNRTTVDRNSESTKGIEVDLGNPYEQNLSLATISHNYQNISLTQTRDEETIVDYHVALVVVDDSPNILLSIDANDIETSGQKPISESVDVSSKPHDIDSGEVKYKLN